MNERTDRPTPIERQGAPDCLVELATRWLQQPFAEMSAAARGEAIEQVCLLIAQMRHQDPKQIEHERRRWIERVAMRLSQQVPGVKDYDGAVRVELERRVTKAMLTFHNWREKYARPFSERSMT